MSQRDDLTRASTRKADCTATHRWWSPGVTDTEKYKSFLLAPTHFPSIPILLVGYPSLKINPVSWMK